jgi:hypothetical protein
MDMWHAGLPEREMIGAARKVKPIMKLIRGQQKTRAAPGKEGGLSQWSLPGVKPKAALAAEALFSLAAAAVSGAAVVAAVAAVAPAVPVGSVVGAAVASAAVGAGFAVVGAAPVGAAAVAAQGQVLVSDMGLPGPDLVPDPLAGLLDQGVVCVSQGGLPEKDESLDTDRVFVLQAGAFDQGLASVPQVGDFQLHCHGTLSATRRLGRGDTCYKNSDHNADHNGGRANRDIFAKKSAHIEDVVDTRYSTSAHTSKLV